MDKLPSIDTPKVEKNALKYLASKGYLEEVRLDGPFRLTARGWDYHEQLRCPPMFWFKNNWFPTIVALGTIITSVTAIVT